MITPTNSSLPWKGYFVELYHPCVPTAGHVWFTTASTLDVKSNVWQHDGFDYPGFPIQTGGYVKHIALGDIDGDGEQEIVVGSRDNRVHAWKLDGTESSGFPKVTLGDVDTTPALADIDGDDSLEMVAGSNDGRIYIWEISDSFGDLAWPMIRQNLRHTGTVPLQG